MSVIAPPESPPEVQSPYDQGFTPRAPRVSSYRRWTRVQQAGQVAVIGAAVAVSVGGGALAGVAWASSVSEVAILLVALVVAMAAVTTLIERGGVRRALAGAEPMPDGAIEVTTRPLLALTEPRLLLAGAVLGGLATLIGLLLGAGDIAGTVAIVAGICLGRVASLQILLRAVVERAQPAREFFVELEPDPAPREPPLLWRPAAG